MLKFKMYAGVLCAYSVVMAYVGIGFVHTFVFVIYGKNLELPGDWSAAMLSLASAALGFLIGKQERILNDSSSSEGSELDFRNRLQQAPPEVVSE